MAKDINNFEFDEATKLKLKIFGEAFQEWLPVFLHEQYTKEVFIYDFFAGSGKDSTGFLGSPLVLLDKAKGDKKKYCQTNKKQVHFIFNEAKKEKAEILKKNVTVHIEECKTKEGCGECVYNIEYTNSEFQDILLEPLVSKILHDKKIAKFILLDQYGFKEIGEDVFRKLASFPKTDFIFFIASSFIKRFKEHPNTTKFIPTSQIDFENRKPEEVHRAVAEYFKTLIPDNQEYYIHHFSIKKDSAPGNYYGLIFGTGHTYGMEKFLKTCWKIDEFSGEANYNIDNNFSHDSLFASLGENVKKARISKDIEAKILSGEISDNISGLKYAMKNGCEPKLFTHVVKELEKNNKIFCDANRNNTSTNIHKAKKYSIELKNET